MKTESDLKLCNALTQITCSCEKKILINHWLNLQIHCFCPSLNVLSKISLFLYLPNQVDVSTEIELIIYYLLYSTCVSYCGNLSFRLL